MFVLMNYPGGLHQQGAQALLEGAGAGMAALMPAEGYPTLDGRISGARRCFATL
jgi:hypothetical protein